MAEPIDSFRYRAMGPDMLRLIRISPARDKDEHLALSIRYCARSDLPPYIALSYTWGTAHDSRSITIGGRAYSVRRNLHDALLAVDAIRPGKWLWVDALCINQEDIEELNAQVRQMDTTYSAATEVLAWLGAGAQASVMDVAEHEEEQSTHGTIESKEGTQRPPWMYQQKRSLDGSHSLKVATSEIMQSLASRPYWKRMWIIQEITLAKHVTLLWEDGSMPFEDFRKNMTISDFWNSFADRCSYLLPQKERIRYLKTADRTLFNMILETRECRCHDLRDRFFALMTVIDSGDARELKEEYLLPDYKLAYTEVVLRILRHIKNKGEVRLFRDHTIDFFVALGVPEVEAALLAVDIQLCKDVAVSAHNRNYDWKALAKKYDQHRGQDWDAFFGGHTRSGRRLKSLIVQQIRDLLVFCDWSSFNQAWPDKNSTPKTPLMVTIWDILYQRELRGASSQIRSSITLKSASSHSAQTISGPVVSARTRRDFTYEPYVYSGPASSSSIRNRERHSASSSLYSAPIHVPLAVRDIHARSSESYHRPRDYRRNVPDLYGYPLPPQIPSPYGPVYISAGADPRFPYPPNPYYELYYSPPRRRPGSRDRSIMPPPPIISRRPDVVVVERDRRRRGSISRQDASDPLSTAPDRYNVEASRAAQERAHLVEVEIKELERERERARERLPQRRRDRARYYDYPSRRERDRDRDLNWYPGRDAQELVRLMGRYEQNVNQLQREHEQRLDLLKQEHEQELDLFEFSGDPVTREAVANRRRVERKRAREQDAVQIVPPVQDEAAQPLDDDQGDGTISDRVRRHRRRRNQGKDAIREDKSEPVQVAKEMRADQEMSGSKERLRFDEFGSINLSVPSTQAELDVEAVQVEESGSSSDTISTTGSNSKESVHDEKDSDVTAKTIVATIDRKEQSVWSQASVSPEI